MFFSLFFFFPSFFGRDPANPGGEGGRKEEGEGEVDKVESVNYKPATGYPGRKVDPQS